MSVWAHVKEKGFEARVRCGLVRKSADQAKALVDATWTSQQWKTPETFVSKFVASLCSACAPANAPESEHSHLILHIENCILHPTCF